MLLTAKITKPNYVPGIIDRPRLYRQLDRWQEFRAVVIRAPAGYGKSTLASRWIDISGLDGRAAWFSLDEDDSSPYQFIHAVAAALDSCHPGLLASVQPALKDVQGSAQRALMRLLAVLEEDSSPPSPTAGQDLLLVLDDLQRVESPEIASLILKVLEYGPDNLHLLLLARQRGELSLARLYAHGAILALDKQDLRFTEEEVQAYLWEQGFPTASAADAAQLTMRSEGWVSSLHLAILSLRERGSIPELLRALHGDREWLADFLAEEVLDRRRPDLRLFLLQTAILNGFSGSLCTAVTGMDDANAKLAEIARADLFLIEMKSGEGWFRYHHLFQELLQQRLAVKLDAGAIAELHRRAADWLAGEGQIQSAVHHLLAGGFEEEAAELVESRMRKLLARDLNEAKRLLGMLPQRIWQQRPRLLLDRCLLAEMVDDRQSLRYVQQAAEFLQAQGLGAENAPALHGEWLALCGGAHLIVNDIEAAASFARQAQPYAAQLDDLAAGLLFFLQMHLLSRAGEHAEMLQAADRALAAFAQADFVVGMIAAQRQIGKWSMERGNSREATEIFHEILDVPPQDRPETLYELATVYDYAAENSYWLNDLKQAEIYQKAALALARQLQDDLRILLGQTMGMLYFREIREVNFQKQPLNFQFEPEAAPALTERLFDLEIRRLSIAGYAEEAWAVAQKIGIDPADSQAVYRLRAFISYLQAYIARGLDLAAVSGLLMEALNHAVEIGLVLNQLQLLALKAWQELKLHGVQTALTTLAEAANLAQETGYVRVLLDIPELAELLPEVEHAVDYCTGAKAYEWQWDRFDRARAAGLEAAHHRPNLPADRR